MMAPATTKSSHSPPYPELGKDRENEVEHHPGVDADPAHRQDELHHSGHARSVAAERSPPEDHRVHRGAVTDHVEGAEDRASDDVAEHHHQQSLDQAEPQRDTQCAQHPVDRRDVRARPDPEQLPRGTVAASVGYRLDSVRVERHAPSRRRVAVVELVVGESIGLIDIGAPHVVPLIETPPRRPSSV